MKSHTFTAIFNSIFILLNINTVYAAKLYRWVDANGNVSYSDKVPPQDLKRERVELSETGRTIAIKEAAKTPEQLAVLKKIRALQKTKQVLLDKQLKEDDVLLRTFQSEAAIDEILDGKIGMLDTQILQTKKQTGALLKQLLTHQKSAANYERQGKEIPKEALKNIESSEKQYQNNQKKIKRLAKQKITLTESFQNDKSRFVELKENTSSKPIIYNQGSPTLALGELNCIEADCVPLWNQAVAFTEKNAMTNVIHKSKNLFLTATPSADEDLTLGLSKDDKESTTSIYLDIFCKDSKKGKIACKSEAAFQLIKEFNALKTVSLPNE
jgi:ATP-dependent helicase YprA (DUF1998 family)